MANVLGSVIIQDLTYTQKVHGQAFTITYENGATAGAETVRLNGLEVIIKIASGTSTATQIRTAFNACVQAVAIAICTVSGTGSNTQKSGVRAFLSGGAFATKAAIPLPFELRLVAQTAGTAGNSIRIKFVDTGSVSVSASTNDITINVDDGVSTFNEVVEAIRGSASVGALIQPFCPNDLHSKVVDISGQSLPTSFTALSGGTALTSQAVTIQDLTYTSSVSGPSSKRMSVTYTHGATAGSEVVTVSDNGDVTVKIQNGTSTATQIKAVVDTAAPSSMTVAITGTGSTAQKTVNQEGGTSLTSEATPSTKDYYNNQGGTALTSSYVAQRFGFHARTIYLKNDESGGSDTVSWSFNGTDTGGTLNPGESITLDLLSNGIAVISLKGTNAPDYHINVVGV